MFVGAAFFFAGAAFCFVTLARAGGLAMGMRGWHNVARLLGEPERRSQKRAFLIALALAASGGVLTCGSVMAGDAKRNARCTVACERLGYGTGRYRGNPHVAFEPGDPYDCWCHESGRWSAEAVPF